MDFEEFFTAHQTMTLRIVYSYVRSRDVAEDLVIESFLEVHNRWDRVLTFENPVGYLVRIAVNRAKKWLKRKKPDWLELDSETVSQAKTPESVVLLAESEKELEQALLRIKEEERVIILLRDLEKNSFDDIAGVMDMKLPTVKSHYRRGKQKLAAAGGVL